MPRSDARASRRRGAPGAVVAAAAIVLLFLAYLLDPLPEGLNATFFSDANWSGQIVHTMVDHHVSTDTAFVPWRGSPPDTFSAAWSGAFVVTRDGTYTFATASDDGSWLYVDRELVVDNGGFHSTQLAKGSIHLTRGVHAIFVKYFQQGGGFDLRIMWARDGGGLQPLPAWALAPRFESYSRFLASVVVRRAMRVALWLTLAAAIGAVVVWIWRTVFRFLAAPFMPSTDALLLVTGAVLLLFVLPHEIDSDGIVRYHALAQLLDWHDVSSTPYSFIGPLFSAPLYLLGNVWMTSEWWVSRFNAAVFVAGLAAFHRLWRTHVERAVLMPFLLLLVAGSMFPHHVQGYFSEVFTSVLVAVGLAAVVVGRPAAGWTAAVVGVVNAPATVVALTAPALQHTWHTRRLRYIAPIVVAFLIVGLESWIRRGSPFVSGYQGNRGATTVLTYSGLPGFSYPMFFGILSILFSFGKGLVFFAPGLVLWMRRRTPHVNDVTFRTYVLWMGFVVGLILVYAKWWAWYGGWFWGPRFFLFASFPASLAIAVALAGKRDASPGRLLALFVVLSLSAWVAVEGGVFEPTAPAACFERNFEPLCWYVPEFSPLWRPFVEFRRPTAARAIVGAYFCIVYLWFAAPLVLEIFRRGRAAASGLVSTHVRLASWRI
jgi:PA14 domain